MEFPTQMRRLETQAQFEEEVMGENSRGPACVLFSAAWCGPCKKIDKDALVLAYPHITWYGCDVDVNSYTHGYCGLQKIPSFAFFRDGRFVDRLQGTTDITVIDAWLVKLY
jgi:thioredoxin-like negative regulator of GroEL